MACLFPGEASPRTRAVGSPGAPSHPLPRKPQDSVILHDNDNEEGTSTKPQRRSKGLTAKHSSNLSLLGSWSQGRPSIIKSLSTCSLLPKGDTAQPPGLGSSQGSPEQSSPPGVPQHTATRAPQPQPRHQQRVAMTPHSCHTTTPAKPQHPFTPLVLTPGPGWLCSHRHVPGKTAKTQRREVTCPGSLRHTPLKLPTPRHMDVRMFVPVKHCRGPRDSGVWTCIHTRKHGEWQAVCADVEDSREVEAASRAQLRTHE